MNGRAALVAEVEDQVRKGWLLECDMRDLGLRDLEGNLVQPATAKEIIDMSEPTITIRRLDPTDPADSAALDDCEEAIRRVMEAPVRLGRILRNLPGGDDPCPSCGSESFEVTLKGAVIGKAVNTASCSCGHSWKVLT